METWADCPAGMLSDEACPVARLKLSGLLPVIFRPVTVRVAVPVLVKVKERTGAWA